MTCDGRDVPQTRPLARAVLLTPLPNSCHATLPTKLAQHVSMFLTLHECPCVLGDSHMAFNQSEPRPDPAWRASSPVVPRPPRASPQGAAWGLAPCPAPCPPAPRPRLYPPRYRCARLPPRYHSHALPPTAHLWGRLQPWALRLQAGPLWLSSLLGVQGLSLRRLTGALARASWPAGPVQKHRPWNPSLQSRTRLGTERLRRAAPSALARATPRQGAGKPWVLARADPADLPWMRPQPLELPWATGPEPQRGRRASLCVAS